MTDITEHSQELPSFYEYCEYHRIRLGLTVSDICRYAQVTRQTYYRWRRVPTSNPTPRARDAVEALVLQSWSDFCISPRTYPSIFDEMILDTGLTPGQLARLAGVNLTNLEQWMTGEKSPSLVSLVLLIEAATMVCPSSAGRIYSKLHKQVLASL